MPTNLQEIFQTEFNGVNDSVQPDAIPEGQLVTMKNMMKNKDIARVSTRHGIQFQYPVVNHTVLSVFEKQRPNGQWTIYIATDDGTDIEVMYYNGTSFTSIWTQSGQSGHIEGIWFCGWSGDRLFFSDDFSGLYTVDTSSNTVSQVKNKNKAGWNSTHASDTDYDAPYGRYLTEHKGRIFLSHGNTAYHCGSDDTSTDSDGNAVHRWENWTALIGPDETTYDDGGDTVIMPLETDITGMASTNSGLMVFKEKSVALWTWPDSAAPWEIAEGADISTIVNNFGCVDGDTIAVYGDTPLFIGSDDAGNVYLAKVEASQLGILSGSVPDRMKTLGDSTSISGELLGYFYFIADDDGVKHVYDIMNDCWSDISEPFNITKMSHSNNERILMVGTGGLYSYPALGGFDIDSDNNYLGIDFEIESGEWMPTGPFRDFKSRMFFLDCGSRGNTTFFTKLTYDSIESELPTPVSIDQNVDTWDDGDVWNDPTPWGGESAYSSHRVTVNGRGKKVSVKVWGTSQGYSYIARFGIGYRNRQMQPA